MTVTVSAVLPVIVPTVALSERATSRSTPRASHPRDRAHHARRDAAAHPGTSGEFIAQFVLGWYKLWGNVNELGTFWLLMLLVPAVVLLPQVFYSFYMRRFHPQFRDLAMECEYHGLPIDALKAWQIPAGQRQRRLVKGAPRPLYQASRFQRLCASLCGSKANSESARSTATRA